MANLTSTSGFLLLEFSPVRELQVLHFFLFLALYLIIILGNLLIIVVIALDHRLHIPMYFFLMNLAISDIGSVSVTLPKSMFNLLMNSTHISYFECVSQIFFFLVFECFDFAILTIMAHDRYVAICNPLQYELIMNKEACIQMTNLAWITSVLYSALHTAGTFSMSFCSNIVDQFFCEIPKLMKLSCSDLYLVEVGIVVFSYIAALGCFIFIIKTYVWIFTTVLKIPSKQGQHKALSTCLPHLLVVSLYLSSGTFVYATPHSNISPDLDLVFSVIYAILPSLLNPFIYSLRSKEIQTALQKLLTLKHLYGTVPRFFLKR
ncbi:olfactory receptor 14A16-like [Lacerta agilis]|uniref:olfactory receptor 14A16-like n=1 Tax=Lacerta agilis TaxID=80427 RepID=UPI001419913C|nr:olfactory receptor 14A16-like [Lacerta agilis]